MRITEAYDYKDNRNYDFELFSKEFAEGERINQRPYKEVIVWDQGQTPACTRYALRHICNGQNINEYASNDMRYEQIDPITDWNKGDKRKYLQSALDLFKKWGVIEGYLEIKKDDKVIENIKKALSMGLYIYTGSDDGLWGIYRKPYNYMKRKNGKIVGHAWSIVDDRPAEKRFVVVNSFGTDWGDKGYFYLPYEDISSTFTLYPIIDKDESGKFKIFKMKEKIKQFLNLAKDIYGIGDSKIIEKFNQIQLSKFFKDEFNIEI